MEAFYRHIADAIVINKARARTYAERTQGKSRAVSRTLVWFERGAIPLSLYIDWRARKFWKQSIPIVGGDLVSMSQIPALEAPIRYRGRSPATVLDGLGRDLTNYRKQVFASAGRSDFQGVVDASAELLHRVEGLEAQHQAHLCMAKHVVESIGIAALHSLDYAERSGGATVPLSRTFLKVQAMGLPFCVPLDRMAQPVHELGVGILVNDVPAIPFLEELGKK